jgi:hypothetical protein
MFDTVIMKQTVYFLIYYTIYNKLVNYEANN